MSRVVRVLALCTLLAAAASLALADDIPSPLFPPNPWEDLKLVPVVSDDIPSPLFPPNPWEDLKLVSDDIPSPLFPPNPWEDLK